MLAYAADRRRIAASRSAPHAMLGIAVAHIALIAVVMSAKLDVPRRLPEPPTVVDTIPVPEPPPPQPQKPPPRPIEQIQPVLTELPLPLPSDEAIRVDPSRFPNPGAGSASGGTGSGPVLDPAPPLPVRIGPRFATPSGLVRPPYPPSKISSEEEAVLRLRLSIDVAGRVVSVEPVGPVDRAFLDAARRHILARWRYKPASDDGRAVASSTVITLRFELD